MKILFLIVIFTLVAQQSNAELTLQKLQDFWKEIFCALTADEHQNNPIITDMAKEKALKTYPMLAGSNKDEINKSINEMTIIMKLYFTITPNMEDRIDKFFNLARDKLLETI